MSFQDVIRCENVALYNKQHLTKNEGHKVLLQTIVTPN